MGILTKQENIHLQASQTLHEIMEGFRAKTIAAEAIYLQNLSRPVLVRKSGFAFLMQAWILVVPLVDRLDVLFHRRDHVPPHRSPDPTISHPHQTCKQNNLQKVKKTVTPSRSNVNGLRKVKFSVVVLVQVLLCDLRSVQRTVMTTMRIWSP